MKIIALVIWMKKMEEILVEVRATLKIELAVNSYEIQYIVVTFPDQGMHLVPSKSKDTGQQRYIPKMTSAGDI